MLVFLASEGSEYAGMRPVQRWVVQTNTNKAGWMDLAVLKRERGTHPYL